MTLCDKEPTMQRFATITLFTLALTTLGAGAQAPAKQSAGQPKVTWYFYTVKWGFQDEFVDLFQRNHYPILKAKEKAGMFQSVKTYVPEFHGDGRADWTFAVELIAPPQPPTTPTDEEIIAKLYPDRAKFNHEEQRRFEILLAHWDVPLNRMDLDARKLSR
jgi:hypothetical protein